MKKKLLLHIILLLFTGIGLFAQPIVLDSIVSKDVSCGGLSDGSLTIYVSGGSGTGFNYELRRGFNILENSGLTDSTWFEFKDYPKTSNYLIIISDNNPTVNPIFPFAAIGGPDTIQITSANSTDLLCEAVDDGTVTVTAVGEKGNLHYYLTGPQSDDNLTGAFGSLQAGTYQVEVRDDDGCPSTDLVSNLIIDTPPPLTVTNIITDATCFNATDGEIDITAGGGTPGVFPADPYTYAWTGTGTVPTDEDQIGLGAGNYDVIVTDGNGCTVNSGTLEIKEAAEILMSIVSSTDVTCNGGFDGKVNITVTNGTNPLDFLWQGVNPAHTSIKRNADDLYADIYELTITDNDGCIATFPAAVEIFEPNPITVTFDLITEPSCFGFANGSAAITISGGTGPYVRTDWTGPVSTGLEDPTGILSSGIYTLEIEDSNGCIQIFTDTLDLGQPEDITASLIGFTDALCFGSSTGTAQVLVEKGTPGYAYLWTGDGTGHTTTMASPDTLKADVYDLQITDANACVKTFNDIVTIGEPADITSTITVTDVLCNTGATGEIDLEPANGTPPYTYVWTGPGISSPNSQDQTGLIAGTYEVTVTDANLCSKVFSNIDLVENTAITASFVITDLTCNGAGNGAINATIAGGVGPYSYSWVGDLGYSNNIDEDISPLDADNYTLTVTDAVSCVQAFAPQTVSEPDPLAATFTPTDAQCFQSDDGEIAIDITGGTGPYITDWTGPGVYTSSNEDITGLEPGAYSLHLEDVNSCFIDYPNIVSIVEPDDITLSSSFTDITCASAADGTISVAAADGTPGYTYLWSGPGGFNETTADIINLEPGQYDVQVTDSHSCIKNFPNVATLTDPSAITVTFDSQVDLDCFGDSNGSIDITAGGGVPPLTFLWTRSGGAFVSAFEDPSGLTADVYSLQVTDNSGCMVSYPDTIEITEPTEVLISLAKTDIDCYGDPTGTITVTTTGGVGAPYQYKKLGDSYQASNVFTGLTAGTYTIFTKDANDCEKSDVITINQPAQITYSDYGVSGSNTCNGDADATIYINTVNGGVPPYQYTINGGTSWQMANSFPNLPGGSYDVRVKDSNSCERTINNSLLVDEPFPIAITFMDTVTVSTCYDTPEGEIQLMANGGTGTLLYSLDAGPTQAAGLFTGLIGGTYDVHIIDDSLCTKDTTAVILRPTKVVFNQADITAVTGCFGDSNGELDMNAIGGTGAKQYSLDAVIFQVSGLFTGLPAGDTTVTAIDTNGCTSDTTLTITEPAPITYIIEAATDVDCNGASTGTVTVEASGGTLPYTYTLNPPLFPANDSGKFVTLPAGSYTIDVNDAGGCGPITSSPLIVGEPSAVVIDSVVSDYISCSGAGDAEIFVFVSGGTPPYSYSYDNEATYIAASSRTMLGAGIYDVFVIDANGCSQFVNSYTFVDPPVISLTASLAHVSPCFGGTNGEISASATGGWDSFEYSIDGINYQASGVFGGLAAGDYNVFTRDTGTCSSTMIVSITEPTEVTATVDKTDYVDDVLGTITISDTAGGVPPYEYAIDGLAGTFTATTVYTDLIAGMYDVVVRDDSGCVYVEPIQIFDIIPLSMIIDSADVSCFGADDGFIEFQPQDAVGAVQYSIDDGATFLSTPRFEDLPGNTLYILRAFDDDGKIYWDSVFIAEPSQIAVNIDNLTAANCNAYSETGAVDISVSGGTPPYTVIWSNGAITEDLINVVAGDYSVEVTDNAGCSITEDIFIPALVIVNADAGQDTTICQGESIILNAKAGDIVLWEPATYLSNQGIADPVANNVQETITYTYTETESGSPFGCYDIDSLTIDILPTFGVDAKQDTVALVGQLIQLEAVGGPFVSYVWIPSSGLDDSNIADPIASAQSSITYYVNATNEFGCVETDSVLIEVIENITVYNAFSPNNGDDINQYFEISNAEQFPDMLVEVYSRWGSRVFSSVGYTDDKRWDGTARGKDVPIGTYYYIIIPYPDASPITGNVTILR